MMVMVMMMMMMIIIIIIIITLHQYDILFLLEIVMESRIEAVKYFSTDRNIKIDHVELFVQ